MRPTWLGTLDAFEHHLDLQTMLIEDGRYDEVLAFVPPTDLPNLPTILVARALELLDRAVALSERTMALHDATGRRLAQARHLTFAEHPASVYLDLQV